MFNFGGITHIIDNPNGTFSYVGSVPGAIAGKVQHDIQGAVLNAVKAGATLCAGDGCACRKLFPARSTDHWRTVVQNRIALGLQF